MKHLDEFLSQRECTHSYTKDNKPREKDAKRAENAQSLISVLCYKTKKIHVANFMKDPVLNLSYQAVSAKIIEKFAAPSVSTQTSGAAKNLADLAIKYCSHFHLPMLP